MKKMFLFLSMILYVIAIIILRKYPENHICSFLIGVSNGLVLTFFAYVIAVKNQRSKK